MNILSTNFNYIKFKISIEMYDESIDKYIQCEFEGAYEGNDSGDYFTPPVAGIGLEYMNLTNAININNKIYEKGTSIEELTQFCDYDTFEKMNEFIYSQICEYSCEY